MTLRRGFKSEANAYARDLRAELGLAAHSPLCQWRLNEYLGYRVLPLSSYVDDLGNKALHFTTPRGQKEFSAVTIYTEDGPLIIHNDWHNPKRQAANLAHEAAHGLLHHKPSALFDGSKRAYDAAMEEEANWLGPALLISDEAALLIANRQYSLEQASELYHASIELVRFRLNVCGAFRRAA